MVELVVGVVESEDIIDAVAYFALNFAVAMMLRLNALYMALWLRLSRLLSYCSASPLNP